MADYKEEIATREEVLALLSQKAREGSISGLALASEHAASRIREDRFQRT